MKMHAMENFKMLTHTTSFHGRDVRASHTLSEQDHCTRSQIWKYYRKNFRRWRYFWVKLNPLL